MHSFKKGDTVYVINCTIGGMFFVEGQAIIKRIVPNIDEQYVVDFGDKMPVQRFVDPRAQGQPVTFVERLNDPY